MGLLGILSILPYALAALLFAVCVCIAPLAPFASCIVDGIYSDILDIGKRNVYLRSIQDETSVPVSTIFSGFKSGFYKASAQTLIFRNVFLLNGERVSVPDDPLSGGRVSGKGSG